MDRYQVTLSMVLIGSKDTGATPQCTPEQALAAVQALVARELARKTFASGNSGFFASGKVSV